jgi:hypothetical protein
MPDHEERSPSTLAHGAAKASDVDRVREDVDNAEMTVAHQEQVAADRRVQRAAERGMRRELLAAP